ncbi:unnamed protein product [Rotaria sordida]|uniref:Uncharacterized protein n=1 Tax=Rotaria sordida TaxID=392033 RepID=A0A816ALM8_9BILA|nr:unnamed protein product [Rotaria sordida]CAF1598521.1 unnamed protein product [Rotaria sordida]
MIGSICEMKFKSIVKSSIVHSSNPRFIAVGDLNNDNKIDMAVANFGTDTIGIFLSNDDQTFSNEQIYSTGFESRPSSIVINDFNNDNSLDIVVANSGTNNIGLFIGYHNGTFHDQIIFSTSSFRPWFIAAGDFNKDYQLDIAIVYYNTDNIGILMGNHNGSFQSPIIYSTGYDSLPRSLAIGDFDNDNQLDIVVANYGTNNIRIFMGYFNGTFASEQSYTINHNSNPSSVVLADLNNDHQLDIIVANHGTGNLGIFLGHHNGTFAKQITYLIGSKSRPQFLSVGYFDKNNYPDVVVVDSENDQIHVLLGCENSTFCTLTTYDLINGSSPMMVAIADFDNDNQSDIAIANYGTNYITVAIRYFIEPSIRQATYFVGRDSRPSAVVIHDFNNDGKLDLAIDNFNDNYILILNGDNNGTFVRGGEYSTGIGSSPQYQCLADLNNDNRMDIIIANLGSDCVGVLLGQDNGTFTNIVTYSTGIGSGPWFVAVGDLNNDNHPDIVSANINTNNIGVLIGFGNGSFADVVLYFTGTNSNPISITVGDVNNDNQLDIVVSLSNANSIAVFLGNGTGIFGMFATYSTGKFSGPFVVVLADFNRDNNLDIAVANPNTGNVGVFLGVGNGTFMKQVTFSTGSGSLPYFITVADFNHDNYADIAVTNTGSNEVLIFTGNGNGHFELARRYPTGSGSGPYGIAVADLKNDKQLMIVVTYWGNGYVAVLTEYNAAEFVNRTAYLTGSAPHPYSLAVGNFNNDNRPDIVVANSDTNDLIIYFASENGSFNAQTILPIGIDSYPQYVITGDINTDKQLDIITVNSKSNTINIIMGDGNGNFSDQIKYSTGPNSHPYGIAMSDFNNDGRVDFVIANEGTDSIGVLFGFHYASFQNPTTYSNDNNQRPMAIIVNDFNNDNYIDIATVFSLTDNLAVLLGYGNASFGPMITYSTGIDSTPYMLAANDFNNDGQMDIVVANYGTNNLGILIGYNNGSFATMTTYSTGFQSNPFYVAVGDFNNDNRTDIISVNWGSNSIGIFLGYGNGNFAVMITYSTGDSSNPCAAAVGDINHDDQLDIVVVNYGTSTIGIFLGYGNGNFQNQVTYSTGYQSWPTSVVIGDFDNDNQSDIGVANFNINNVGIFLGYGNGSFSNVVPYSTGDNSSPQCAVVGDFNNDKILDIAVTNYGTSGIAILFGFGDGSFLLGTGYSTGMGSVPSSLAAADFNNDTRLDIAVAGTLSNTIVVLLGYGYESFADVTKYNTGDGSMPHSVAVADFNNDGWSDVIVANYGTDNVGLFLGYGTKGFDSMITFSTGINSAPYCLAIGHFNNDNYLDIVVTNSQTDNVVILFGFDNGTFTIGVIYSTGARSQPSAVAVGDLNQDNILDIVIANFGTNSILILYGYGNGSFGNDTLYQLGYEYRPTSVVLTDLNNDNWTDIAIACYNTDHLEILMKMC